MIELLTYTNTNDDAVVFYDDPIIFPVKHFDWLSNTPESGIDKPQSPGRWDVYSLVDVMAITMECDILTDDSTAYWTARKLLLGRIVPDPTYTTRNHGRLTMTLTGDATVYYADVILKGYSAPLEAMNPSVSACQFQWDCNFGYWRKVSDDTVVVL